MLVHSHRPRHAQRMSQGALRVGAAVLTHHHGEVVEGVGDARALGIDLYGQLLVGGIVVDIGAGGGLYGYGSRLLAHHHPRLHEHRIGVVLAVYLYEIVARERGAYIVVGKVQLVVHIVGGGAARVVVSLDGRLIEAVEILALGQYRGPPVGIAAHHAVAQILAVVGQVVKRHRELLGRAERHIRHGKYVASGRDLKCAEALVHRPGHGIVDGGGADCRREREQ